MANVTGASLTPILQRLNSVSGYHPYEASTFADWAMESGDVVTITQDGRNYSSPVHSTRMVWKGTPHIQVNSTGNKERESISLVSKKKYRRGTGGMRSSEEIHRAMFDENGYLRSVLDYTESHLRLEFMSADASIRSALQMTESRLRTSFDNDITSLHSEVVQTASYWHSQLDDTVNSLHSYVDQTASHWHSELVNEVNSMRSVVNQTASDWYAKIYPVAGQDGVVTPATIALAINAEGSNAIIDADKVYIGNTKSTTVINGKASLSDVTAEYIAAKIETLSNLLATKVTATEVEANTVYIKPIYGMGKLSVASGYSGSNLTLSGNTYTLTLVKFSGQTDTWSFSRATQLSGSWSGRNYSVTATPQGNVNVGTVYDGIVPDTSDPVTYEKIGNNHYVKRDYYVYSQDEGGDADKVILHKEVGILANAAYDAGYTDGSASGGSTTLSASWTGSKLTVTASPQGETLERLLQANAVTWNGTTATIPISSVYGSSGQYSDGVVFSPTVNVASKLQTKTVTANGTYTPDTNYIGLSSIEVNVTSVDAKARFNAASGQYYIEAYDNQSGNAVQGSQLNYQLGLSGTNVQIQNMSGSRIGSTPQFAVPLETRTVTENGTYTPTSGNVGISSISVNVPGYDSAHVAGSWGTGNNANVWTVSKTTSGTANNVSMTVTAGVSSQSYNSSTHRYTAYGYAYGDGTQVASSGGSVSGLEAYNDGWAAARAKLSVPTGASTNGSIAVKYPSVAVGDQGTTNYYPSADNNYAYIRVGSATGTAVARVSHGAYGNGWSGCYGTVGLDSTTAKTLGYGETVTVYAQAKASSGASGKTNVASRTLTGPADRYQTGYDAGVSQVFNNANFGYTSTPGSYASFIDCSVPGTSRHVYVRYKDANNTWHNQTSKTWYVPLPKLYYVNGPGSNNTNLTPGAYICVGYNRGGYDGGGDCKFSDYGQTYYVPTSSHSAPTISTNSSWYMPSSATEANVKSAASQAMGCSQSSLTKVSNFKNNRWVWFKVSSCGGTKYYYTQIT